MTSYLSWNFRNWVSVVLMALIGFAVLTLAAQTWQNYKSKKAA